MLTAGFRHLEIYCAIKRLSTVYMRNSIGDGTDILLWYDPWLPTGSLLSLIGLHSPLPFLELGMLLILLKMVTGILRNLSSKLLAYYTANHYFLQSRQMDLDCF